MCSTFDIVNYQNYLRLSFLNDLLLKGLINTSSCFDADDIKELNNLKSFYNINSVFSKKFLKYAIFGKIESYLTNIA